MDPKFYTAAEARVILRVGRTRMSEMLVSGELKSFKVGQRRRVAEEDLKAYVAKQMATAA